VPSSRLLKMTGTNLAQRNAYYYRRELWATALAEVLVRQRGYKGKERCEYYLSRPSLLPACLLLLIQTFVGGLQTFYYINRAVGNLLALPV